MCKVPQVPVILAVVGIVASDGSGAFAASCSKSNAMDLDKPDVVVAYRFTTNKRLPDVNNGQVMSRNGGVWMLDNRSGKYGGCFMTGHDAKTGQERERHFYFGPGRQFRFNLGDPESVRCSVFLVPPCDPERYTD